MKCNKPDCPGCAAVAWLNKMNERGLSDVEALDFFINVMKKRNPFDQSAQERLGELKPDFNRSIH